MNKFCILISTALCLGVVWAKSESTTPLPAVPTSSKLGLSGKVKRQYQLPPYARPPNYSPYVGDAAFNNGQRYADATAQTINQIDQKDSNGNYNYAYETTNGIKVRQTSYMVGNNRVVTGYYSYIGPDGKLYTTHYTSDQNGYRATGSHLPVQDGNGPPAPIIYGEPIGGPAPNQFPSSTPGPFVSTTPFGSNPPYSPAYSPAYSPTTLSPIVSSSTPFQTYTPSPQSYTPTPQPYTPAPQSYAPGPQSYIPPSKRLPFPIYRQPTQSGYTYDNPRVNSPYSVVSQQTPAPISYPTPTFTPASSNTAGTTLAPPIPFNDYNSVGSSTVSPLQGGGPVQFKPYIPPPQIVTSTPMPFNSFLPNQPDTILITPKPAYQPPNSLSINQNLVPPYLSVGPLNSSPQGSQNNYPTAFSDSFQPTPPTVAPLIITNFNYRKKRDEEK